MVNTNELVQDIYGRSRLAEGDRKDAIRKV